MKELALMNLSKTEYAKKAALRIPGCKLKFSGSTFNEFVIETEKESEPIIQKLTEEKILGGVPLKRFYPELDHHLLVAVTEMNRKEEIDRWAEALEKALKPDGPLVR